MQQYNREVSRRTLLKGLSVAALSGTVASVSADPLPDPALNLPMPVRHLGKKRVPISLLAVGGWHQGMETPEPEAIRLLNRAFELGVTFFDAAFSYGEEGQAEKRIGMALSDRRDQIVLMSKSTQRTASDSERELDESLKRLRTDHVDIWQFHALANDAEVDTIVAKGGAVETARKALADGRIRTLGATGHATPSALNRLIELVPEIEAAQFPVNCVDPHWKSFIETTIPKAKERGLSILAMKTLARGTLTGAKGITVDEAHRYALSQPITAWVTGVTSVQQLEQNIRLAKTFKPMTAEEQKELLVRSLPFKGAAFEDYKTWGV